MSKIYHKKYMEVFDSNQICSFFPLIHLNHILMAKIKYICFGEWMICSMLVFSAIQQYSTNTGIYVLMQVVELLLLFQMQMR